MRTLTQPICLAATVWCFHLSFKEGSYPTAEKMGCDLASIFLCRGDSGVEMASSIFFSPRFF